MTQFLREVDFSTSLKLKLLDKQTKTKTKKLKKKNPTGLRFSQAFFSQLPKFNYNFNDLSFI